MSKVYRGIAFEGGGVAGIAHGGVIKYLNESNRLDNIKYFIGSSAGSIACALIACKIKSDILIDTLYNLDMKQFKDNSLCCFSDLYRIINKYGYNKGNAIEEWFGNVLKDNDIDENITFKEVYEIYGNYLIITSTDFGYGKTIYYTPDNSPNERIKSIVRESSSIPLYFCPIRKNNNIYIDGGTLNNYPIRKLYDYLDKNEVFGINIMTSSEFDRKDSDLKILPTGIIDYIEKLIDMIYKQSLKIHIKEDDWKRTIAIDVGEISTIQFNITKEEKDFLLNQGYISAKKFFN